VLRPDPHSGTAGGPAAAAYAVPRNRPTCTGHDRARGASAGIRSSPAGCRFSRRRAVESLPRSPTSTMRAMPKPTDALHPGAPPWPTASGQQPSAKQGIPNTICCQAVVQRHNQGFRIRISLVRGLTPVDLTSACCSRLAQRLSPWHRIGLCPRTRDNGALPVTE